MNTQFLERVWYFGGWSDRLAAGEAKAVALAGKMLAVYRSQDGSVAALGNRCPHRFSPLHRGKVKGEYLECPYHGLQFGPNGKCVFSPHNNGAVPPLGVPSYSVIERDGAIWIWLSQQVAPDPALIPDMSELITYPRTVVVDVPTMYVNGSYELLADNLMDPTHADFVHFGKLGNGLVSTQRGSTTVTNGTVETEWNWQGPVGPIPHLNQFLPNAERVDTWLKVRWNAPGVIRLENGVTPAGHPRQEGFWVIAFHIFMPSGERTATYDVRTLRSYRTDDVELTAKGAQLANQLFNNEDKPLIEAQQAMMGDTGFWDLAPALLPSDAPSVKVRRTLASMIEAEQATTRTLEAH